MAPFDELAVLFRELKVESMLLESIGDTATIEAILQLTHAVVVEGLAVIAIGHGRVRAELRHGSVHSRSAVPLPSKFRSLRAGATGPPTFEELEVQLPSM